MKHVTVKSSHIASVAHKGDTMHVTYRNKAGNGPTYAHTPITAEDHAKIMKRHLEDGESIGKIIKSLDVRGVRLGD